MSRAAIGRWLREPLVEFLLVGLLIFAGYQWLDQKTGRSDPQERIEFTPDDISQIRLAWLAQGREDPSPEELQHLVDARVREEILYREALALGLDQDDTIVRRRMAQKMEFLFEDVAALRDPTTEELEAWFDAHAGDFTLPARATFRHLYFSPDLRGVRAREDAVGVLAKLAGQPVDAAESATLGDPFMFQAYYADRSFDEIARNFGPGFAAALFEIAPGAWSGPIESGYGSHVVWVDDVTPARVPALASIEADVRRGWIEEQRTGIRQRAFEAMRARYEVVLPGDLDAADIESLGAIEAGRPESQP